ncbi:hypothetical protein [Enterocloster bolteae]|uniref:hypothetical protein n=1 Tax=Enterocloster bolteae TaxID=208479 RepID=UPI002A7F6085|nr:hypothetical protein [Enterocloster bolteae]
MRWNKACNFRFAGKLNNTKNPNKTGNGMTERQQLIAYKQAVQAANNKSKQMLGIKTLGIVGLNENNEYFFFCGIWCRIKLLDLRLAVPSLWMHDGNTRGFLLAETDLSRMLVTGSDSRDEYHYLIDIWDYNEHR